MLQLILIVKGPPFSCSVQRIPEFDEANVGTIGPTELHLFQSLQCPRQRRRSHASRSGSGRRPRPADFAGVATRATRAGRYSRRMETALANGHNMKLDFFLGALSDPMDGMITFLGYFSMASCRGRWWKSSIMINKHRFVCKLNSSRKASSW